MYNRKGIETAGASGEKGGERMNTIYEPTGAAREYSHYALNVALGCDNECRYCYVPGLFRMTPAQFAASAVPRPGLVEALGKFLNTHTIRRQVLLSFTCDPYCEPLQDTTHEVLKLLLAHRVPTAILTKCPAALCVHEGLLLREFGPLLKLLTTLTCWNERLAATWEPGAESPWTRAYALEYLARPEMRKGVSIEPVLFEGETMRIINETCGFAHEYLLGKLNHMEPPEPIDWETTGMRLVGRIRETGRDLYVKKSLQAHMPVGFLMPEECDPDRLSVRSTAPTASAEQLDMFGA